MKALELKGRWSWSWSWRFDPTVLRSRGNFFTRSLIGRRRRACKGEFLSRVCPDIEKSKFKERVRIG
jgi:hypothetical protein